MQINFTSKVNKSPQSYDRTIQVYVPPFRFCFLNFIPVDRAEQATKFVPVTEPAP